jgi:hypothetical protein
MRLPYALQIQSALASKLTSVGLPTAPPISESIIVSIYFKYNNRVSQLIKSDDNVFLMPTRINDKAERLLIFTKEFIVKLRNKLKEEADKIDADAGIVTDTIEKRQIEKSARVLRSLLNNYDNFSKLLEPSKFSDSKQLRKFSGTDFKIARSSQVDQIMKNDTVLINVDT